MGTLNVDVSRFLKMIKLTGNTCITDCKWCESNYHITVHPYFI